MFSPFSLQTTRLRKRHAFTLIEILVVVAIVCLMAALFLGVFTRVREKGRQASCQSNLKQIQQAVQLYLQDSGGLYPAYYNSIPYEYPGYPNKAPGLGWAVRIQAYMKSTTILQCPTESTPGSDDPKQPVQPVPVYNIPEGYTDYGYNCALSDVAESKLAYPSRSVTFIDVRTAPAWSMASDPAVPLDDFMRHSGGGNCAFADGHVKWFLPSRIYAIGAAKEGDLLCKIDSSDATFCLY